MNISQKNIKGPYIKHNHTMDSAMAKAFIISLKLSLSEQILYVGVHYSRHVLHSI